MQNVHGGQFSEMEKKMNAQDRISALTGGSSIKCPSSYSPVKFTVDIIDPTDEQKKKIEDTLYRYVFDDVNKVNKQLDFLEKIMSSAPFAENAEDRKRRFDEKMLKERKNAVMSLLRMLSFIHEEQKSNQEIQGMQRDEQSVRGAIALLTAENDSISVLVEPVF